MQVSVSGLRRNIKNIAHNYTEPQKKVREATSNDPWGPSSTLMGEIADLTYNIEAFAQIMEMLWKRLNDHGKNWRHVYKSLVLLEYLIKTGSERVAQQCKENIFAIQTLKDFQYFEDNKDQGLNVREKAKQLVTLLSSEERLRTERTRAIKARERFAQTVSGFGSSDSNETTPTSPVFNQHQFSGDVNGHSGGSSGGSGWTRQRTNSELENARPQTIGEEELQLQLALAMSKEEADQEEKRRRSDELRLQMALSQSEQEFKENPDSPPPLGGPSTSSSSKKDNQSALLDLLDVDLGGAAALPVGASSTSPLGGASGGGDPWAPSSTSSSGLITNSIGNLNTNNNINNSNVIDPWAIPSSNSNINSPQDPWSPPSTITTSTNNVVDPWNTTTKAEAQKVADPWAPNLAPQTQEIDEFETLSKRTNDSPLTFKMDHMASSLLLPENKRNNPSPTLSGGKKKDPLEFLGENSNLVNLDNLLPPANNNSTTNNNIISSSSNMSAFGGLTPNPFGTSPTQFGSGSGSGAGLIGGGGGGSVFAQQQTTVNPFHTAQNAVQKPTINEIRERQQQLQIQSVNSNQLLQTNFNINNAGNSAASSAQNNPWSPVKEENPFMG